MRIPLATDLATRDGTLEKDAGLVNALVEVRGKETVVKRRPGAYDLGSVGSGSSQLLAEWNGLLSVIGDSLASISLIEPTGSYLLGNEYYAFTQVGNRLFGVKLDTTDKFGEFTATGSGVTFTQASATAVGSGSSFNAGLYYNFGGYLYNASPYSGGWVRSGDYGATWAAVTSAGNYSRYSLCGTVGENAAGACLYGAARAVDYSAYDFYSTANPASADTALGTVTLDYSGVMPVQSVNSAFQVLCQVDGVLYLFIYQDYDDDNSDTFATNWVYSSEDYGVTWSQLFREETTVTGFPLNVRNVTVLAGEILLAISSGGVKKLLRFDPLTSSFTEVLSASVDGLGVYMYSGQLGGVSLLIEGVTATGTYFLPSAMLAPAVTTISALSPLASSEFIYAESNGEAQSTQQLLLKNSQQAWVYTVTGGLALVTDVDYPGAHTVSVSSITRSGTTATVTTSAAHPFATGDSVLIAGAAQADYNGTKTVTVTDSTHFTYTVSGSPTTPATGTITARGGSKRTVPGIAYLDGTFYVMDEQARIWGSALGDGTSWSALNFVTAEHEPGAGVALGKSQNNVIAFKEWSTEFFYDAANATGSPLSPVQNGFNLIGCASGHSLATVDGVLVWVSQSRQKGRSVYAMSGLEAVPISTPDVERVLNRSTLETVHSYGLKLAGHTFYVLTLVDLDVTLVYDFSSKVWATWSSLTLGTPLSVTSITRSGAIATVQLASANTLADGDPVLIAGAGQSAYNGITPITWIDSTHFSYVVDGTPTTPATGTITVTPYTESYFKFTKYAHSAGKDLLLHESDGHLYSLDPLYTSDAAIPIDSRICTGKLDQQTVKNKLMGNLEIIGNKSDSVALVRWSDDDYTTFSTYRRVDLSATRSQLRRCGDFRRRAFELRNSADAPFELSAFELSVGG